jgi:hypothetical protein
VANKIEEKIVFAIGMSDGVPLIVLGVPKAAWEYMKDGKTHEFDFTKAGLGLRLVLFGAEDHDSAMKTIHQAATAKGEGYIDARNKDFSIPKKDDPDAAS